jgi:ribosomal protein L11 methyltransferase
LHEWKKHYKPFRVGQRIVIVPIWEEYEAEPGDVVFIIDPGSVFGTGLHQTTRLSIVSLEEYVRPGDMVLDIGCGSGILSVISLLLQADFAFACDFDPAAAIATRDNALRNPIKPGSLQVETGDIFKDTHLRDVIAGRHFDIVVANIVADVVIRLAGFVKQYLKPDGIFIASGIIGERMQEVELALLNNGFTLINNLEQDGWFCLVSHA